MMVLVLLRIARLIASSIRRSTIADRAFNVGAVIIILAHIIGSQPQSLPRTLLTLLGFALAIIGLKWVERRIACSDSVKRVS